MPSSGARSGTPKNDRARGSAGSGSVGPRTTNLKCGHKATGQPAVEGVKILFFCPEGCGLQAPTR